MVWDTDAAIPIVQDAWASRIQDAENLLAQALYALNAMNVPGVSVPSFNLPPDVALEFGQFLRPVAPPLPEMPTIDITVPTAPVVPDIDIGDPGDAPAEPNLDYTFSKPAAPNVTVPTRPAGTDVTLEDIVVPDAPVFAMPSDPQLYTIDLPTIPDLVVPAFDGVRPILNLTAPTQTFNWTFVPSDPGLIPTIKSRLNDMLVNGLALPAHIEQQIYERLRTREDQASRADEQDVLDQLSARGLRQPAGMVARLLDRVRTKNRTTTSAGNRDIAIRMAEAEIDAVKTALASGIQLELGMLQNNLQENELKLRAAQTAQEVAISLFNASVALHNAEVEAYRADAQVFGERIRALQAQADLIKTRMEGAKIMGDLNESLVRAYGERVRAVTAFVEVYRAQIEAAKTRGEINVQRLEQQRIVLQGYATDVDAYGKQWDAYAKQMEAEAVGAKVFETSASIYAERNRAWATKVQAIAQAVDSRIKVVTLKLEGYRAQLAGVQAQIQAKATEVQAVGTIAGARAQIFSAEGQVSAAESAAQDRTAELALAKYRAGADIALKQAETVLEVAVKNAELILEMLRAKAQIYSQMASSVMSGVSASANIGFSAGYSESRSSSVSWAGEAVDWNGGLIT